MTPHQSHQQKKKQRSNIVTHRKNHQWNLFSFILHEIYSAIAIWYCCYPYSIHIDDCCRRALRTTSSYVTLFFFAYTNWPASNEKMLPSASNATTTKMWGTTSKPPEPCLWVVPATTKMCFHHHFDAIKQKKDLQAQMSSPYFALAVPCSLFTKQKSFVFQLVETEFISNGSAPPAPQLADINSISSVRQTSTQHNTRVGVCIAAVGRLTLVTTI